MSASAPAAGLEAPARAAGPRGAARSFAAHLTALADAERGPLGQVIVRHALDGQRWAIELLVRHVFAHTESGDDALTQLLEELRARLASDA